MARKSSKRGSGQATPPLPYGTGMHEVAYGPGTLPSLYNGQMSVLAPQVVPAQNVTTDSGMNSPSAASNASGLGLMGSVQASLLPAGQGNPMEIFAAAGRKFPLETVPGDGSQGQPGIAPASPTVTR